MSSPPPRLSLTQQAQRILQRHDGDMALALAKIQKSRQVGSLTAARAWDLTQAMTLVACPTPRGQKSRIS